MGLQTQTNWEQQLKPWFSRQQDIPAEFGVDPKYKTDNCGAKRHLSNNYWLYESYSTTTSKAQQTQVQEKFSVKLLKIYPLHQESSQGMGLEWNIWCMPSRRHTGVAPIKFYLAKWGIIVDDDVECECGKVQNVTHLTICGLCPSECTLNDLWFANTEAVDATRFWTERV